MSISENFKTFCNSLIISNKDTISKRYKQITKRLNTDFWDSDSEITHSLYGGSYGRGTAINNISDVDMYFILPYSYYEKYNKYTGNGQSSLLQEVKDSIKTTYSNTSMRGDGQVVVVQFTDGVKFEVVPIFLSNSEDTYIYADTNDGGSWKATSFKKEINEINSMNEVCNKNLKKLCKMIRSWRANSNLKMGGLLIDTLCYNFLKDWKYKDKSFGYYDWMSRDFFEYLKDLDSTQNYWLAVGSKQYVWKKDNFTNKAKKAYEKSCEAIEYERKAQYSSEKKCWREIFGTKFPS